MMQGNTPEHSDTVGLADNPPPHASEHGPKRTDESYYDSYYMACGDPSSACAALLRLPHTSHMPQHSPSMRTADGANRVRRANLAIRAAIACLTDAELSYAPHHSVGCSRSTRD